MKRCPLILNSDWVSAIRFTAMSDSCVPEWEGDGEEEELERRPGQGEMRKREVKAGEQKKKGVMTKGVNKGSEENE